MVLVQNRGSARGTFSLSRLAKILKVPTSEARGYKEKIFSTRRSRRFSLFSLASAHERKKDKQINKCKLLFYIQFLFKLLFIVLFLKRIVSRERGEKYRTKHLISQYLSSYFSHHITRNYPYSPSFQLAEARGFF